jgi:hypothetical protein
VIKTPRRTVGPTADALNTLAKKPPIHLEKGVNLAEVSTCSLSADSGRLNSGMGND